MAKMGFETTRFRAKYGNVPVDAVVDGQRIQFKSKLEYRWAQYLDFLKTTGQIKDWFYEFCTFYFPGDGAKEYTPDFVVRTNENELEYHETKGKTEGRDFQKWLKLGEFWPHAKLTVIYWNPPKQNIRTRFANKNYCERVVYNAKTLVGQLPNVDLE